MSIPIARSPVDVIATFGPNSEQNRWSKSVAIGALGFHPFSKVKGGTTDLNQRLPGTPIITTRDTNYRHGTKVQLQTRAPLGGWGVGGSAIRSNKGEQEKFLMYQLATGVQWHGVKRDGIAVEQTELGTTDDLSVQMQLRGIFGWKTGNHIEAVYRGAAFGSASDCVIYANERVSTNDLGSADTFNINDVHYFRHTLSRNQAEPFSIAQRGATDVLGYVIMVPSEGLIPLETDSDWNTLLSRADTRGDANHIFGGGLPKIGNTEIFGWTIQDNAGDGPQGAFCYAHAYLGAAIAAGTATFSMKGGKNAAGGALTDRAYFIHFPGARWKHFQQEIVAQETELDKFLLVKNRNTGKFAMFRYRVIPNGDLDADNGTIADANTITILERLGAPTFGSATLGRVTYNTGIWAGKHHNWGTDGELPIGSEIWPCNDKGQTFVDCYGISKHMIVDGYGMINKSVGVGMRTVNKNDDHQSKFEWGYTMSYGGVAVRDANGLPKGIVLMRAAYNVRGLPTIPSGLS